jgi:hypothetical protein
VEGLPIESQFQHHAFMQQVGEMSPEQMRVMLGHLHLSFLGHREFIKTTMKTQLGIETLSIEDLD